MYIFVCECTMNVFVCFTIYMIFYTNKFINSIYYLSLFLRNIFKIAMVLRDINLR